jgi:hypothetical protein
VNSSSAKKSSRKNICEALRISGNLDRFIELPPSARTLTVRDQSLMFTQVPNSDLHHRSAVPDRWANREIM